MRIIPAKIQHIEAVVDIFSSAFENSINFFTPINDGLKYVFKHIFKLLHSVFDKGFMVAVVEEEVCGYIIMADNIKRLWLKAFSSGFLLKMAAGYFSGAYSLKLSTIYKIIKNKLFYMKFELFTAVPTQLLSIAVNPKHQGKGIGKRLLEAGIKYIESRGMKQVKLEVRPDNTPAFKLYESFGFRPRGKARDLQGEWIIMVRE
jgi:ribosomal-protein-alanine N-acetyltransferase